MYGELTCLGRHTVTGMLAASGNQFVDWSGAYRLFSKQRVEVAKIMNVVQSNLLQETGHMSFVVAHMDDTIIKKTGKLIPGTARRDPLGPQFQTNFIWGQRFIQLSLALPRTGQTCQSSAIPVDFHHCSTVVRPRKTADKQQWQTYQELKKKAKLSRQGSDRIVLLRKTLNEQGHKDKELVVGVDGSYTNREVLKNLPQKTTLVGRIRKDTRLYALPEALQDIRDILQAYLWRWEIEVDFREEKSLLGCGQAQVRNPNSAESLPAFVAAMYGLLHLASHRATKNPAMAILPRPKWYPKHDAKRITTGDLLNNLRAQLWAKATDLNFSDFVNSQQNARSLKNKITPKQSAPFYLRN